jgi:hypothetical protein
MKQNRPLFKIGKYIDITDDDLYINDDGHIVSKSNQAIDENLYRIKGNIIQKRIDFVRRYKLTTRKSNKPNHSYFTTNTLYQIIPKNELVKLYDNDWESAHKQIGALLTNIYL